MKKVGSLIRQLLPRRDVPLRQNARAQKLLLLLLTPLTAFWLMQLVLGSPPWNMSVGVALANWLCLSALYWIGCAIIGYPAVCCVLLHILAGMWGAANYFVSVFRGTPILPWDFKALGTAVAVAGSYSLSMTWQIAICIMLVALLAWALRPYYKMGHFRLRKGDLLRRGSVLIAGLLCLIPIAHPQILGMFGVETDVWDQLGAYQTGGAAAEFLRNTEFMEVEKPDDTTPERVNAIVNGTEDDPTPNVGVDHPNIVAIMNESWADFEDFGNLTLTESPMNYINSVSNAIHGHAYTSVFGAGTSTSEFEFLTGNTMAFLPSGSIPYQQYINGEIPSLVSYLDGLGYDTYAMHPYYATGWNRDKIYPDLGFSHAYFIDAFTAPSYVRKYVDDASCMKKIIDIYESKQKGQPMFLFNVTMQNHGGYQDQYGNFTPDISVKDSTNFSLQQYLSLVKLSDSALEHLISYFEEADEKTVIVFFGDHQPSDAVASTVLAKNGMSWNHLTEEQQKLRYQVPYVVWANYDIGEETGADTSVNYLAAEVLERAGVPLDEYRSYLLHLKSEYPVISAVRTVKADGSEVRASDEKDEMDIYRKLQYYELFDHGTVN